MRNTDSNLAMASTGGARIRKARQDRTHEKHMIKNCCIKGYIFGMAYISLFKSPAITAVAAYTGSPHPTRVVILSRFHS